MQSTPASTPNQLRYRDANARLAVPDKERERVIFFGDSITEGWLPTMPAFFSGRPYVDRGISGETTGQMLMRFDQDVIALRPRVVVILAGTNDIAGNDGPYNENATRRNLETMAERAHANGIRVVMASLVPARDYPWRPGLDPAPKIVALNTWIRQHAAKQGLTYLDYFTAMSDSSNGLKPNLGDDGVHPNLAGYQVMAPLAERAVRDALGGNVPLSAPIPSPLPY